MPVLSRLIVLVSAIAVSAIACDRQVYRREGSAQAAESAYARIMRTKEIRVGYLTEPPYLSKSTANGTFSGVFADVGEEMARRLGAKLVWVEEVGLPAIAEALRQKRFDLVMLPLWRSAERAKDVGFSVPIFFSTVGVYVRAGDNRFDKSRELLNSENVRVAAIDGELAGEIARRDYPLAKVSSLPQLTDYSQLMMEVATRKADVTFYSRVSATRFMERNPGRIKDITGNAPIRVYAECLIMPIDDFPLRSMIDATLQEMIDNGDVDRAFKKNGENPGEYYRPAVPFRSPVGTR